MSRKLEGLVALVTGGSRGIGAAIAKRLAAEGATVAINYARSEGAARDVAGTIAGEGGRAEVFRADLGVEAEAERLVREVVQRFGRLDIVVNNAAAFEMAPLAEVDGAAARRVYDLNVFGLLGVTRAALPHLPKGRGRVINISSIAGKGAAAAGSVYWSSKSAVDSITRSLAAELGPRGITVNAVAPGLTETDMAPKDEAFRSGFIAQTPLGRIGHPEDIAGPVAFLASEDAAWITRHVLDVSGGLRV
jgi:3-oxoacyl-[acyl-carrier protein] reductase